MKQRALSDGLEPSQPEVTTARANSNDSARPPVSEQIVSRMKRACSRPNLQRALTIGRLVIDGVYDGDLALWRKKSAKSRAFRELASRTDLPLSSAELYRCAAIYELVTRTDARNRWPRLSVSQLRLVIGLEPQEQCALLERAHERGWSVTRMNQEVRAARMRSPERRGRPPLHPVLKALQAMARALPEAVAWNESLDGLADLDPDELQQLAELLSFVRAFCDWVCAGLARANAERACEFDSYSSTKVPEFVCAR